MADIELVIKIPEEKIAIEYGEVISIGRNNDKELAGYIFAGTPLTESDDCVSRGQLDKCLYELRMDNIYDMPSFWCHDNKDYRVIPTKYYKGYEQAIMDIEEKIAKLPSVQPKPKTGHWTERKIHEATGFFLPTCSECGKIQPYTHHTFRWNYCPNCGARMESEE